MRNILKAATIESKFPLLAVEHGCIVSKDADITVACRVDLPELFTVTSAEYEAIHAAWCKAVKVLPEYSIVHKQDWFIREQYRPQTGDAQMSFLSRSYERHFNERPYLNHSCFFFLTKTTKERMRMQSNFSTLCRGNIIPKEVDRESTTKFLEAVDQFERILNDSGFISIARLSGDEITGTAEQPGLLEKYFTLSLSDTTSLQDVELGAETLRVCNKRVCLHTLSDTEDLPGHVGTDMRYERLSTDRSDCLLSFAAPVGLLLSCDHIYNQYLFLESSDANLQMFEKRARNMQSLSRYSRSNQINKEWIDRYLNEAHSFGLLSIRAHFNVMAWSDDAEELRRIRNDVGSQLALMECRPRHNTVDAATLYWAGMPGNVGDFPAEESFYTFVEPALCFFTEETNYKSSPSPFGIKMCDRISGKPLHLDISDEPMKRGVITNRNKFVLGPSGSGKSFFMNHLVRQYWEQGTHVVLVDTGNSYQGLCELVRRKTKGEDGIYFFQTRHEQHDRRWSQSTLRAQVQIELVDKRTIQSPERQIRQIELRRQKTGQMLKSIFVARCGLCRAIDADMFLEAFDKPSEIAEQRLLPRRHTQQPAFDLLGRHLFAGSGQLAANGDSRSSHFIQPSVDFDRRGAFPLHASRRPQRPRGRELRSEDALRPAHGKPSHYGTTTRSIRFGSFEVERHLYFLLFHNPDTCLQN